jgi:hypothetical protein
MFKQHKDKVFLDGMEIPLALFKVLEPNYSCPSDIIVMFYDGERRHYRTKNRSWSIMGAWDEGERYLSRKDEFARLVRGENNETVAAEVEVANVKSDLKAKYAEEDKTDVELHKRTDLDKGGTKRVRPPSKRTPRS